MLERKLWQSFLQQIAITFIAMRLYMTENTISENYFQIFTFSFVLDKDLQPWMVDIQLGINLKSSWEIDNYIK